MTFEQAGKQILPFGPFKGNRIAEIGTTDPGILHLESLTHYPEGTLLDDTKTALRVYLADPDVASRLRSARGRRHVKKV
jgi:hypothetical protein